MKTGKKASGGRYTRPKKKKATGRQNQSRIVKIGEPKTKTLRTRGGNKKTVAFENNKINLISNGKAKVVEIKNVLETPSNTFLARQNILTKGSIIETEMGKARITNKPSGEGNVQGILITE